MPRMARIVIDDGLYHVLTRGNNGQPIFREPSDYHRYMELLINHAQQHAVKIYHFSLIPSQVHLILAVPLADALSRVMSRINLAYSWVYRKRYRYSGHLWQGRFKSSLIEPIQLLDYGRHVELAAVRAGLVAHPAQHPWSSYHRYAAGAPIAVLAPHPGYHALGAAAQERQDRYRRYVQDGLTLGGSPCIARTPGRPRKLEAVLQKPIF